MTVLVSLPPVESGRAGLDAARLFAVAAGEPLVVCTVIPEPWNYPSSARVDAEYDQWRRTQADRAIDDARETLGDSVEATFVTRRARSVPAGLLDAVAEHGASTLVVGSSSGGPFGRVVLGRTSDRLLHSSPVPLVLAPRGFTAGSFDRATRLTCAFAGTPEARDVLTATAALAGRLGVPMRVATFLVGRHETPTAGVGLRAEATVLRQWQEQVVAVQREALATLPDPPAGVDPSMVGGRTWGDAVESLGWTEGDVLVLGSSAVGMVTRVFLGSRANKILRRSPVPTMILPRPTGAG